MKATRNGKIEAVKRLLAAGCALNVRDKNNDTALHFAARHGGAALLSALITAGADVNMQNQWGHTPLMEVRTQQPAAFRRNAVRVVMLCECIRTDERPQK